MPATAQVLKRPHEDAASPDQNQSKINAKAAKHYPRAIGVLEFLPGGATRLVPVALWIDDRFYDASLYGANPAPMAVEPYTVYEATNYGERLGLFTITNPEAFKGGWIAAGKWKPKQALDEKMAAEAAKQPKPKPASTADDERPTLKREGDSGSASNAHSNGAGSASSSGTSANASGASPRTGTGSSGTPSPAEDDPNRPTLKKPSQPTPTATSSTQSSPTATSQTASAASSESRDENDPNRPALRRGKPEPGPASVVSASADEITPPNANAAAGKARLTSATITHSYPAVSDAGPFEARSLLYAMNDTERAAKSEQMSTLALDEVRKFIAQRHTPALPGAAAITDSDLRAYDLDYHNNPTIVFTGSVPVPGAKAFRGGDFHYFVTVVAHEDINGAPVKIFSSVSDSNHLDVFPRLEIIDAVDADANGRGDLLFRQYSDIGISYSLYRVFPYDMQKVFEGGSGV